MFGGLTAKNSYRCRRKTAFWKWTF